MKWVGEVAVLPVLALLLAGLTWLVRGAPERGLDCEAAELPEGYICYDGVAGLGDVVWVDARTRDLWQKNGIPGSVLLTDHPSEDWDSLMAEAGESLMMADAVVVYCATEGCGSSEPVAEKIREIGLVDPERVYVLKGGFQVVALKGANRRNPR